MDIRREQASRYGLNIADVQSVVSSAIGGMNIAGGISAALFHRDRTGEAIELDVSLLSTAWWAAGSAIDLFIEAGKVMRNRMPSSGGNPGNLAQSIGELSRLEVGLLLPGHMGIVQGAEQVKANFSFVQSFIGIEGQ